MKHMLRSSVGLSAALAVAVIAGGARVAGQNQDEFRFKSGVDLINVTATVVDRNGRFVAGLGQDDFVVYEENELQEVTHFSNERVPVSLGLVLDTSGSMVGEKITNALMAVDRFLTKLLSPEDEIFLYKFNNVPDLIVDWTTDRQRLSRAIRRISANGGTAMYDAVAESVPLAQTGSESEARHRAHFGWQRHGQPGLAQRREAAHPRERSDGLRDRHRRAGHGRVRVPSINARPASASAAHAQPVSRRQASARARRRQSSAAAADSVAISSGGPDARSARRRRARQRAGVARNHR